MQKTHVFQHFLSEKQGQNLHRSPNSVTLRCDYRRTVDEIYLHCGAFFDYLDTYIIDDFLYVGTTRGASMKEVQKHHGRPTGRPYK